ncbi:acyl carrier protein [Anderseniella sp. Alg231-50]|uniref:acyl carrier protein n=1 Tax=Anderseniella sp. Alg231-50 TaxID=1922226 RepID=UPI00307C9EC6
MNKVSDVTDKDGLILARKLLAAALELDEDKIEPQSQIVELPGFDSLAYERLVASVEDHLDRDLDPLMMVSIDTVSDLAIALAQHKT